MSNIAAYNKLFISDSLRIPTYEVLPGDADADCFAYQTIDNTLWVRSSDGLSWLPVTGGGVGGGGGVIYDNIAEMRAAATPSDSMTPYELKGHHYPGDGGGGNIFMYVPTSTKADNNGTVIKPTAVGSGAGAYEMLMTGQTVQTAWFGGIADKEDITVDVTGLTATKKIVAGINITGGEGPGGAGLYRYWGDNIVNSEATTTAITNAIQIFGPVTPVISVGDVIEQFRGGVWVRIGVVYTNPFAGPPYGMMIKNELGLGNDGVYYQTRVLRLSTSIFTQNDVGKTMVIERARLFPAFNTMNVGLNCKITAVDGGGIATFVNLDTGRGNPANTTGTMTNGVAVSNSVMFTDATDGIAAAVKFCQDNLLAPPHLGGGWTGCMPVKSNIWASNPEFVETEYTATKSPFMFKRNSGLRGKGMDKSFLSFHYAVPNRVGDTSPAGFQTGRESWEWFCYVFFCEPTENTSTWKYFEDFTVVFPYDETTNQPYLLMRDYGGNSYVTPQRHAQKVFFNRVKLKCPLRNVGGVESNYGDIFTNTYDTVSGYPFTGPYNGATVYNVNDIAILNGKASVWTAGGFVTWNNALLDYAHISFKDCDLESAAFTIKHTIVGDPTKYCGKKFDLIDTIVRTGVYRVFRHYTGSFTGSGSTGTVTINEANYSPYNFNLHYDYQSPRNIFLTPMEIKKRETGVVASVSISGSNYNVVLTAPYTGATNAHGKLWAEAGNAEYELYIDNVDGNISTGGVGLTNGSATVTVPIAASGRSLAEMSYYVGKTIRLYGLIDYVQVTSFGDNRTVNVGVWNTIAAGYGESHPFTTNCTGLTNLDICVNATFDQRGRGNSGHPFYNHTNILTTLIRFKLVDCPNLLRISTEGSLMKGKLVSIDSPMTITKGMYAISSNNSAHQVFSQFEGEIYIENGGYFLNSYGVYGVFKNTYLRSVSLYAPSTVEKCTFEQTKLYGNYRAGESNKTFITDVNSVFCYLLSDSADVEALRFTGLIYINSGTLYIRKSQVDLQLDYGEGTYIANQVARLTATLVKVEDCQISNYAGYDPLLLAPARLLYKNRFNFIRSGVIPNDLLTIGNSGYIDYNYTIGKDRYPTVVTYDAAFNAGVAPTYPFSYPVSVIDGNKISSVIGFQSTMGRVLFLDAKYGIYPIGATTIAEIRISNRLFNITFDYSLFAQIRYANGISIVLIPTEAGVYTQATDKLMPLDTAEREIGTPIRFVFNPLTNVWFEVPFYYE